MATCNCEFCNKESQKIMDASNGPHPWCRYVGDNPPIMFCCNECYDSLDRGRCFICGVKTKHSGMACSQEHQSMIPAKGYTS